MATSGSSDYSVSRNDIIDAALRKLGVFDRGESPSTEDYTESAVALNLLVKEEAVRGNHMWLRDEVTLFLIKGTNKYSLGDQSSDANYCLSSDIIETEVATAITTSDATWTVDDTTGMAASDVVLLEQDSGGLFATTISTVDSSTQITVASAPDNAAAVDNNIYTFTNRHIRPQRIHSAIRRDKSNNDSEVNIISREDYMALGDKTTEGVITHIHYDPQLTSGQLYVWPESDATIHKLVMVIEALPEDFDASTDNPDFPIEWANPLSWKLAAELAPEYGLPAQDWDRINLIAERKLQDARDYSVGDASIYFGYEARP